MTKNKKMMISALPFVALVVLLAVFCGIVSSKGYRLDMYIKIVFNEGIVLSIVATGAIFIYTLGSFDISLGAATLFAATLGRQTGKGIQKLNERKRINEQNRKKDCMHMHGPKSDSDLHPV